MASTPIEFSGEELFQASADRVYALLTDLDAMSQTIPDLVSSERAGDRMLKCVVRPGFSFLRGTMKLQIELADLAPPDRAVMQVAAQGIGVSMRIISQLQVAPEGSGARLTWSAQVDQLKGLVAALSPSLIKAAADQVIRHAWTQVRKQLGE